MAGLHGLGQGALPALGAMLDNLLEEFHPDLVQQLHDVLPGPKGRLCFWTIGHRHGALESGHM